VSEIFPAKELLSRISAEHPYQEFLRVPTMSMGVYVLTVGAKDQQSPHKEDEIYYVIRGKAKMRLGREERTVTQGDVIFVDKNLEHRFSDVVKELVLLVVFAPAESE
jgi:mannose-6-phosphate isomerase-like protein (cupin superfamily)